MADDGVMSTELKNRILHVDGDSFFASCEIALAREKGRNLQDTPVWVGGGRRGDGIVIAANRLAKKFGVKTGIPFFRFDKRTTNNKITK